MNDRRATPLQFPLIPLALGLFLFSAAADAIGVLTGGGKPWDTLSFIFATAGTIVTLRAAVPALEDLLSFKRCFAPYASGALICYALAVVVLCFWGGVMREIDPTAHVQPLLATLAASIAVFMFGHVASNRSVSALADLSRTQRISRASLTF